MSAEYYPHGLHHDPVLELHLRNTAKKPVTFAITTNHYARRRTEAVVVSGHDHRHTFEPLATSNGWYDITVTVDDDESWSRRYVGHLETGRPSITGS